MDYNQQPYVMDQRTSLSAQYVRVFGWMFLGLVISGVMAYATLTTNLFDAILSSGFGYIGLVIAEFALVWFLAARAIRMSYGAAAMAFVIYSALNGLTLSVILQLYTAESIATVFFISAAFFGFMCVYGIVTKQDLSSMGSLLFMGLIGIIIASLVNFFLHSTALYWMISFVGVAVFLGLTAYDSQKIRSLHAAYAGTVKERNVGIIGALQLYLDFVNLFLFILRILGRRR